MPQAHKRLPTAAIAGVFSISQHLFLPRLRWANFFQYVSMIT